ncbi:21049_t:CDS:2 [Entrophospora sp. SA101]|nr:21049_t:CDS:2 [Entrophospora sp. SA101]
MDVLKNETSYPYSLDDFATFLDQTYCLENLEFWLAVQRYKFYADSFYNSSNNSSSELFDYDIPSSLPLTSDATINNYLESVVALRGDAPAHLNFLKQKLHELITTYILPNSSKEINIIASSREDLLTNVFQYNNYHPSILETISHQVYELMQGSSFSQFLIEAGNVELRMSSEESQDDSDNSSPIISRRKSIISKSIKKQKFGESNPVATQEDKEDEDAKKMNKIVGERWERIKNLTHRSNKRSSPSSSNNNGAVDDEKKDENSQSPPLKKFKTDLIPSASWFAYTSPQKKGGGGGEPSSRQIQHRELYQRMNFLYQAATLMTTTSTSNNSSIVSNDNNKLASVGRFYINTMKTIGKKQVIRMDPSVKRTLCKKCETLLLPSITSHVRIKSCPEPGLQITCKYCNAKKKFPAHKDLKLDSEKPENIIETATKKDNE